MARTATPADSVGSVPAKILFALPLLLLLVAMPETVSALLGEFRRCRPSTTGRAAKNHPGAAADVFAADADAAPRVVELEPTTTSATTAGGDDDEDPEAATAAKTDQTVLTFRSSFSRTSDPMAVPAGILGGSSGDRRRIGEFFLDPDHLLAAGSSVDSRLVPMTDRLVSEWTDACRAAGAVLPDPSNGDNTTGSVLGVKTAGISLPGLSVEWSALVGTTLVVNDDDDDGYPELEYVLIKDESKATGARPLVWIYDKLSGRKETRKNRTGSKTGKSNRLDTKLVTRLRFHPHDETDRASSSPSVWVLRCDGSMEMNFRIPSVLGKLPFGSSSNTNARGETPKQAAERKVSALITKQIEKDTAENVARWEDSFREWTMTIAEQRRRRQQQQQQ